MERINKNFTSIGDICKDICSGGTPNTSHNEYYENGNIPWVNTNEVDFCNIYDTNKYITEIGLKESSAKFVPINTIIVAMYGVTAGKSAIAKVKLTTNQACCNLIIDENKAYYKFVYYWLKLNAKKLNLLANGSAQQNLNSLIIKKYKIPSNWSVTKQKKIADILSCYDELIEKNNRKIAILEEQIQELYKEWFVRFRFPRHETVKFKKCSYGRIPIDFEIFNARDVIEDYIGGGWGEEDENIDYNMQAYVIRGTDFERFKQMKIEDIPLRYHKESNLKQRILKAGDFIIEISGGTEEQPVGRICYVTKESLNALLNCAICASFCKSFMINTNIVCPLYFYYFMKTLYDFRALDRYQLQSTGISNFKFEYFLRKCEIVVPPRQLMQIFNDQAKKINYLINYLYRENNNMRFERDLLLPRLMSGKLKV